MKLDGSILGWGIVLGLAVLTGCGKKTESPAQSTNTPATNTTSSSGNPLTAPVDYLGAINRAQKSATRVVDLAPIQQAIQLFRASEDRFPRDLKELVAQQYLTKMPEAPPGMQFAYNPSTGQIRLVAVAPSPTPP
jgi:hypothetical protein